MMLKNEIKRIVELQKDELKNRDSGIKREILDNINLETQNAIILSGIRRCGKSTILLQLMKKIKKYYYFNFEDPRAYNFEIVDFEKLNESFEEVYGKNEYYFFDEIQNVKDWERYIRHLLDIGKKCIITGSNASLLSKELGTKLTGRHTTYEIYPFSYDEMLKFTSKNISKNSFEIYLKEGGFPQYLKEKDIKILQELLNDILVRDVIVRNKIRDEKSIKELINYLITNISKEFSLNKLTKLFNVSSINTLSSYMKHLEDSYLIFSVSKFDYSYKKQLINAKKAYSIDSGFAKANSVSFSNDKGRVLENTVFVQLKKSFEKVFYYRKNHECDFIVTENNKPLLAIQVCYEVNEDNKLRELNGLKEAMENLQIKKGIILTFNQEDNIDNIQIIPAWKWSPK
jgi:hypothetical protein